MTNLRTRIDHRFEALGRAINRHPWFTLLIMLAVIGGLLARISDLGFDTSNDSYFRKDDPTLGNYDKFREQFGREEYLIIAITPKQVFSRPFLEKLTEFHHALEDELPYLKDVTSLVNVRDTRGRGDELVVEDLLKTIPDTPQGMAALKERVLASPFYRNYLVSADGRMTSVVIQTLAFSPGEKKQEDLLAGFSEQGPGAPGAPGKGSGERRKPLTVEENHAFVDAAYKVISRFDGPDFPLHAAGGPPLNAFFEATMQKDMGTFMGLAFLTIAGFLFLLFRRFSGLFVPLLVVLLSLISTIGLMAWTGVPFTIPTTVLPSFLLATGVGASVHFLSIFYRRYLGHGDKAEAISHSLGHSGLPIMMTGLTTAAGLFSFANADMAPVAHMGIFGGAGTLLSLVYTLVLVPALLAVLPVRRHPRFGVSASDTFDRFLVGIADFSTSRPWAVVSVFAAVGTAAVIGLFSLHFSMYFIKWLPESLPLRQATELIDREMKGSINMELVIDTHEENGLYDPKLLDGMQEISNYAMAYPGPDGGPLVGKTNSVVDVLKETNQALHENKKAFYTIPQDRRLVAQELLLFENSGSDDLEKVVDSQFSKARLSLIVPNHDAATFVKFVDDIEAESHHVLGKEATVTVTGTLDLFANMINNMMRSMAESYLIAGVVITLMMIVLIGSLRLGLLSMIPNFTPVLITLGLIMGFGGINLDVFNLTIGSIALGLAVDDTIHFFHNFRRYYHETQNSREAVRRTLLTTGRAMLFTSLVLVTGFFVFMLATLNNVFYFGLLTGVTLFFALAADFFLSPALLELVTRTRFGRALATRWAGSA